MKEGKFLVEVLKGEPMGSRVILIAEISEALWSRAGLYFTYFVGYASTRPKEPSRVSMKESDI